MPEDDKEALREGLQADVESVELDVEQIHASRLKLSRGMQTRFMKGLRLDKIGDTYFNFGQFEPTVAFVKESLQTIKTGDLSAINTIREHYGPRKKTPEDLYGDFGFRLRVYMKFYHCGEVSETGSMPIPVVFMDFKKGHVENVKSGMKHVGAISRIVIDNILLHGMEVQEGDDKIPFKGSEAELRLECNIERLNDPPRFLGITLLTTQVTEPPSSYQEKILRPHSSADSPSASLWM